MIEDEFDFGFTTVSETNLKEKENQAVKKAAEQVTKNTQAKAEKIYKMIMPLLENLKKDSDTNEYIYWPNRKKVIEDFIKKLDKTLKED